MHWARSPWSAAGACCQRALSAAVALHANTLRIRSRLRLSAADPLPAPSETWRKRDGSPAPPQPPPQQQSPPAAEHPPAAAAAAKSRFMNCKAVGNQAYVPTELEHIANVITHGLCVVPSLLGFVFLLQQASNKHQYFNALVYGFALVSLFAVSTVFHSIFYMGRFRILKDILHRCDRAVIYVFIAASYTPWLNLKEMTPGCWSLHIRWVVWLMAVLGILYQQMYHERYKWLETIFYLIIGISPSIAILNMRESAGMQELAIGGAVYILGVIFFKSDGRIPCAHAIWHTFVGVGALFHYYAVCRYLLGKQNEIKYEH